MSYSRRHCLEWHLKNDLLFIVSEFFAKCPSRLARSPLSRVGFLAGVRHAFESFQCERGCWIFLLVFPTPDKILRGISINPLYLEHMYVLTKPPKMHSTWTVIGLFASVNSVLQILNEILALIFDHISNSYISMSPWQSVFASREGTSEI